MNITVIFNQFMKINRLLTLSRAFLAAGCLLAALIVGSNFPLYAYGQGLSGATLRVCITVINNSNSNNVTPNQVQVSIQSDGSITPNLSPAGTTNPSCTTNTPLNLGAFSVNVQSVDSTSNFRSTVSSGPNTCNGTITSSTTTTVQCDLQIFVGLSSSSSPPGVSTITGASSQVGGALVTPSIVSSASGGGTAPGSSATTAAAGTGNGLGQFDSPLNTCGAQTIGNAGITGSSVLGSGSSSNTLQLTPSSATYSIRGTTSLSKLVRSLNGPSEDFTIQIFADFVQGDPITLTMSSPPVLGRILIGTDLKPEHTILYNVNDIRTSCDFVTLVKPNSQSPQSNISPLSPDQKNTNPKTQLSKVGQVNQPPTNNELLFGGGGPNAALVVNPNTGQVVQAIAVNPPFRSCAGIVGSPSAAGNAQIGRYDLRGSAPDLKAVASGGTHTLEIRMVSDLVLAPNDLVKIVNNNNSFVKVSLWVDPGTPSAKSIPFDIAEISSHCESVGFTSHPQLS